MIVPSLLAIQERHGYLPEDELRRLAETLREPLYRIHEIASFYPHYRLKPPPAVDVRVCRDMVCHLHGSPTLRKSLETNAPAGVVVTGVSCLGQCDSAPNVVSVNDCVFHGLSENEIRARIQAVLAGEKLPHQRADRSAPGWRIDYYAGVPRYEAIKQAMAKGADSALKSLEVANLRGMGGAGFPTFRKWAAVKQAPGSPKYVICNADESEPGTFKDRELLRRVPHLIIEGMLLAGFVTGAKQGYIYIRHEYHDEREALQEAIDKAKAEKILGTFDVEVFISPGGYIQGEESALLEAMEDRRGEPRNKPPFPVTHGLRNCPTVINNVETLAWTPSIVVNGGEWYRDQGLRGATGLRFVSISGDVNRPGVYEVPFGQTVRELIDLAGRVRDGQSLKAIAASGPSGGFLPAFIPRDKLPDKLAKVNPNGLDILDLTLDLGTLQTLGAMLGGAFVVYGDRTDMVAQALNCTEFFRNESCGKCVPCRMGTQKMVELIADLRRGGAQRRELPVFNEIGDAMTLTSICGLGMVAANPMTSVMKYFPEEVERLVSSQ